MRRTGPTRKIANLLDKDHPTSGRLSKTLRRHGFTRLGGGASTVTYGAPQASYVVKVNEHYDPAAYKFYSMVHNRRSRYFPKVHLLKTYVDLAGAFLFVVVTEKLYELDDTTWKLVNAEGRGFISWLAAIPDASISIAEPDQALATEWLQKNGSHAKKVHAILSATAKFAELDLFDGNLMVRLPAGDVVLNDPVCTVSSHN